MSTEAEGVAKSEESFDISCSFSESELSTSRGGLSVLSAITSVVVTAVGAGVMAMGQLPAKCGLLLAILLSCTAQIVVIEGGLQLSEVIQAWNLVKLQSDPIQTFEDFGRAACGQIGANVVQVVMIGWQMGACSGYTILISTQLKELAVTYFGWKVDYRIYILVIAPFLLLASQLKDVKALEKITPFAITASFGVVILIILQSSVDQKWWRDWDLDKEEKGRMHDFVGKGGVTELGSVFAIMMGGSGVTCIFPCVANEMKDPSKLDKVVVISCTLIIVLYITVITTGYMGYGNFINENIVLNMRNVPSSLDEAIKLAPHQWTGPNNSMGQVVGQVTAWTLIVNLLFSYPVLIITVFCSIQGTACSKRLMPVGSWNNICMRCGMVLASVSVGCVTDKFSTIFAFVAALFLPVQGVFVPLIGGYLIKRRLGHPQVSMPRLIIHGLMCVLGIAVFVFGTIDSIKNFVEEFGSGKAKKEVA